MIFWKKAGKTALSVSYFLTLLFLFFFVVVQGPIAVSKVSLSSQSILRDSLFPFSLADLGLENNEILALIEFYFQIILGFIGCTLIANTFQKIFESELLITLLITLIFLSPYYSPLIFGVHIINNGYAYPLFLITVRYLLLGLVFKEFSSYLKFFIFSTVAIIMRRHFIFLPIIGFVSLIYSFIFHNNSYYGKKIFLMLALLISIIVPDLSERYVNYLRSGQFISMPFTGFQFAVTPIYVSTPEDIGYIENQALANLLFSIRNILAAEGLLYDNVAQMQDTPLNFRFRTFFESYEKIAYERLKPIIQQVATQDPALVDQAFIVLSLSLIYNNFFRYMMVYTHNIISYMGGYFMAGLMLVIFITSFICHIQRLGKFSLVSLIISFMTFSNYILVALLEPVTQEYGFYTDSLAQALIFSLISYVFKSQRTNDKLDNSQQEQSPWIALKEPKGM